MKLTKPNRSYILVLLQSTSSSEDNRTSHIYDIEAMVKNVDLWCQINILQDDKFQECNLIFSNPEPFSIKHIP